MPTFSERMVWGQGDASGLRCIKIHDVNVGGLICWEHWMPLARQALHDSGEDIHVAAWPTAHEMLQIASRHYAFEGRCFVIAAGSLMRAKNLPPELEPHPDRVLSPEQFVMRGGSAIIGPDGHYIAGPVYEESTILTAELSLDRVREEKMSLDVAGHYSRRDCFDFSVSQAARQ
jgi:predicted amidohydrolase